jgi:polyhydroxybutyrate depolymerase
MPREVVQVSDMKAFSTAAARQVEEKPASPRYQTPGDYIGFLDVDGIERWYTVHIPPGYKPDSPTPLVINLHGYTGTAFSQEELSQMNAKADEEGFIVVNPQAYHDPPTWTGPLLGAEGKPDLDFFQLLLETLFREINIDPERVFATGMSNGATMTNTLGCAFSEVFAAIAPVAGGHSGFGICPITRPVSVLVIHGTDDPTIPYYGREGQVPAVQSWVKAWADRNGCDPDVYVTHPHENVQDRTWTNCEDNVTVKLITREGGGHVWPGSTIATHREGAESEMNATDVIWEFFEHHPRNNSPQRLTSLPELQWYKTGSLYRVISPI